MSEFERAVIEAQSLLNIGRREESEARLKDLDEEDRAAARQLLGILRPSVNPKREELNDLGARACVQAIREIHMAGQWLKTINPRDFVMLSGAIQILLGSIGTFGFALDEVAQSELNALLEAYLTEAYALIEEASGAGYFSAIDERAFYLYRDLVYYCSYAEYLTPALRERLEGMFRNVLSFAPAPGIERLR